MRKPTLVYDKSQCTTNNRYGFRIIAMFRSIIKPFFLYLKLKTSPTILLEILLLFLGTLRYILNPYAGKRGWKLPPGTRALPVIGNLHMLPTLPHQGLRNMALKYGPIMSLWLGQVVTVFVSSPEAAELFLKRHDVVFAARPRGQASDYLLYGTKGMSFTELRTEAVVSLVEELKREAAARGVVDISGKVGELIETITYRMILGRENEDKDDFKGLANEILALAGAFNLADYIPWLAPLDLQVCLFSMVMFY
ncbi:Cytochrome P [Parasponia andersonii]|uniref:Cytochrome P n=1 Tax=Parasponia andersonii TaxID=3476 RepID=A0A2P5BGH4_PARAD|nr:Cytochrome P [Parasponia andersonii]